MYTIAWSNISFYSGPLLALIVATTLTADAGPTLKTNTVPMTKLNSGPTCPIDDGPTNVELLGPAFIFDVGTLFSTIFKQRSLNVKLRWANVSAYNGPLSASTIATTLTTNTGPTF